jgi:outer membrane immunogenic protein
MPIKAPPPPAPVVTWTGFYLGADIGALAVDARANTTGIAGFGALGPAATLPFAQPVKFDSIGFRGGVFGGYDYQFGSSFVAGIEADWHGETNSATQPGFAIGLPAGPVVTSRGDSRQISEDWDASVRARLGYLITPSFLLFATGGGSWQHFNISTLCDGTAAGGIIGYCANFGFPTQAINQSATRTGWTVGGGFETMLSAHWIARADYRYSDYGTLAVTETIVTGAFAQTYAYGLRIQTHAAEFGLRYKF